MGGLKKYERERAQKVRERGPREALFEKQEKSAVAKHLTKQLEAAIKKLEATKDPKKEEKLNTIIADIQKTLSTLQH